VFLQESCLRSKCVCVAWLLPIISRQSNEREAPCVQSDLHALDVSQCNTAFTKSLIYLSLWHMSSHNLQRESR